MILALAGTKGAPGTTTAAFGLAAATAAQGQPAIFVEADPDGGEAALRLGISRHPGLASLATVGRHGLSPEMLRGAAQALGEGLGVVVAPSAPHQVRACLDQLGPSFSAALSELAERSGALVVIDGGRWRQDAAVLGPAPEIVVVSPTLEGVDGAAGRLAGVDAAHRPRWLLVVGEGPHDPPELADHLGLELLGALGSDGAGAEALWAGRGEPRALRSPLGRGLRQITDRLSAPPTANLDADEPSRDLGAQPTREPARS